MVKPRGLDADVSKAWDQLAGLLAHVLDESDAPVLEAGATALAMVRQAAAAWSANPVVLVESRLGEMVANPVLRVRRDALVQWRQFAEQLGVGPVARARLGGLGVEGKSPGEVLPGLGAAGELRAIAGGRKA